MNTILTILAALLLLSILVMVHEFGHYGVGRLLGFTILEYAVGMGPTLLKKEKNGIIYSLRAFPIGGMCRFYGEDQEVKDERCFNAQPAWKRILVVLAGPVMNLIFAVLLAIVSLAIWGDFVPSVAELSGESYPAAVGGIQPGDVIVAIDGKTVPSYSDTVDMILAVKADHCTVTVSRDGKLVDCYLQDIYNAESGKNFIGISIAATRQHFGFFDTIGRSFTYVWGLVRQTFGFFGNLFRGQVSSTDVAGPVGTIAIISQAVRYGMETILQIGIIINISLAIFNILPIPALDGGRTVFLLIELVRDKPIDPEKEAMVHFVGLMALFVLILFLTYNDIANLIQG